MTEFELLDKVIADLSNEINPSPKKLLELNKICSHSNTTSEGGMELCMDCGEELDRAISREKEWRYYGQSDTRHYSDPNRCHIRKNEERTIFKDVENMGFSDKITHKANKIYMECTGGKIYRGNSRKAIVFACIFHSYKLSGKPQTCDTLIKIFNLDRKAGLKGLKHVNLNVPKSSPIRTTYITPEHLIDDIMNKFSAQDEQKKEVVDLYKQIVNKSSMLNRSRPQSVSAALVYTWVCKKDIDISIKEFTKKVGLSELTITKIAKQIVEILDEDIEIR